VVFFFDEYDKIFSINADIRGDCFVLFVLHKMEKNVMF